MVIQVKPTMTEMSRGRMSNAGLCDSRQRWECCENHRWVIATASGTFNKDLDDPRQSGEFAGCGNCWPESEFCQLLDTVVLQTTHSPTAAPLSYPQCLPAGELAGI